MARVLHIEDDPKNRLLVRKLLVAAGHEVIDAETGLVGVRLAGEQRPDLVLCDIAMPDLDGYEVTLRLRSMPHLRGVPIIAITAEGDRETSLAVGADGFIGKPIDAGRFARTVERFLRGHREHADGTGQDKLRERAEIIVERLERKVVELSEANARMEDMARLRREFLQNTTHELATPLTPVVGYLRLLIGDELGPLTPLQRKALGEVEACTTRLRALIDTLLDVSALETGRMRFDSKPFDFTALVARAVAAHEARARDRGIALIAALPDTPLPAVGDAEKIERTLAHVLDNALKFTPTGGEIAVTARRDAGRLVAIVADSGPGVAPRQLEKILEPFYQVDGSATRAHGGVGLGLAFARRVCEAHAGSIEVQSPPHGAVAGRLLSGTAVVLRFSPDTPPGDRT